MFSYKEEKLYHSTVYYAQAHLKYNTDFEEKYGYIPSLKDIERTLVSMKWLTEKETKK